MISNPSMPNLKKVFFIKFTKILLWAALVPLFAYMLNLIVGLDTFLIVLEAFKIKLDISIINISVTFIVAALFLALFSGFLDCIPLIGINYKFYKDKMTVARKESNLKEVPYKNISRVTYDNNGLFKTIFKSGTITLELTGLKDKVIKLEFVDNADQLSAYIQNFMDASKKEEYLKKL